MVTYDGLFQLILVIIGVITLVYKVTKDNFNKK